MANPNWVKGGPSPNPNGKPVMPKAIRLTIEAAAPKAISTLIALMDSDDERVKADAARCILDRAYGKPLQSVDTNITSDISSISEVPIADLVEFAKKNA